MVAVFLFILVSQESNAQSSLPTILPTDNTSRDTPTTISTDKLTHQQETLLCQQIILESIKQYPATCPCPYSRAIDGSRCGQRSVYSRQRSEYSRPGHAKPLCYCEDISERERQEYLKGRAAPEVLAGKVEKNLLPVERADSIPYARSLYPYPIDADGDCQDTRQEVLISESLQKVTLSSDGCRVQAGLWYDPYNDRYFTNPADVEIDHFIPLKEAHISGAYRWSLEERRNFANNLQDPDVLIAVGASANRSKGSRDPHRWQPSNRKFRCEYIRRWVALKKRYHLSYDEQELRTIEELLAKCN